MIRWSAALFFLVTIGSSPSRAGLVMSIENLQQPSSAGGTFEVDLSNPDSTSQAVAGFSFDLMVPAGSGVLFTAATTSGTVFPYLFDGTGGASIDPNFTLSNISSPTSSFTAADTEWTYPSITVGPGATFALGLVSFSIAAGTPDGSVPVSFIAAGTSLSDANGNPVALTTQDGSIPIGGAAVPEPSAKSLAFLAVVIVSMMRRFKR